MQLSPQQLHEIAARCVDECVRQGVGVGSVGDLLRAYQYALRLGDNLPTRQDAVTLAIAVEDSRKNVERRQPVIFDGGGTATDWREIPDALDRLFAALDHEPSPRAWVHAFLKIHPFTDGNGRVAFILFNWINGTLTQPKPLPEFEF